MPKSALLFASAATFSLVFSPAMASAAVHATTHVVAPAPAATTTTATTAKVRAKRMTVHATGTHRAAPMVATHTTVPATHVVATQAPVAAPAAAKPSLFGRMVAAARPAPRPTVVMPQHASVRHAIVPTGRVVTTQTKTGKTVTYNCSKAGNADKHACKA